MSSGHSDCGGTRSGPFQIDSDMLVGSSLELDACAGELGQESCRRKEEAEGSNERSMSLPSFFLQGHWIAIRASQVLREEE